MSTLSTRKLSIRDKEILITLHHYRGMTAYQLTQKIHVCLDPKSSQKSMIHNYLKRLKQQRFVASKKLEEEVGTGSLYYLTSQGFEVTKNLLDIDISQIGNGYLQQEQPSHGDLEYGIYKPPLVQTAHHLLLIDSLLQLDHVQPDSPIDYRLSMYTTKAYSDAKGAAKLRPDAEMLFSDQRNYYIEIDKGTEGYQQLYEKFLNYRRYLAQVDRSHWPAGILFVTDAKKQLYGLKRRWTTILAAYLNAMGNTANKIRLILSPVNHLEDTILFEFHRPGHYRALEERLKDYLIGQGYTTVDFFQFAKDEPPSFAVAKKNKSYQLVFTAVANEFDSVVFTQYFNFLSRLKDIHALESLSGLSRLGNEQILFIHEKTPYLPVHFPADKWSDINQAYTELLHQQLTILLL